VVFWAITVVFSPYHGGFLTIHGDFFSNVGGFLTIHGHFFTDVA